MPGVFRQVGLEYVIKGMTYAIGRANRITTAQRSLNSSLEEQADILVRNSRSYREAASDQQLMAIATVKAATTIEQANIRRAAKLKQITEDEKQHQLEYEKLDETRRLAAQRDDPAFAAMETDKQKALIADKRLEVQEKKTVITFVAAAAAITATTLGLQMYVAAATDAATKTEALNIGLNVTAANAGMSKESIDALVESVQDQQFLYASALNASRALVSARLKEGNASQLAAAANRIAIGTAADAEVTYAALTKALQNGTVISLRSIGIGETATIIFGAMAKQLGKTADELNSVERRQAIYNYILARSYEFTGAYNDYLKTNAYQLRRITVETEKLALSVGNYFLPTMRELNLTVANTLAIINELPQGLKNFVTGGVAAISVVGGLAAAVGVLAPILKIVKEGLVTSYAFLKVNPKVTAILAIISAYVWLRTAISKAKEEEQEALAGPSYLEQLTIWAEEAEERLDKLITKHENAANAAIRSIELLQRPLQARLYEIERGVSNLSELFYQLRQATRGLDRELWPYEDTLERIQARILPITVPLERANRVLQRQLEDLNVQREREKERVEALKDALDEQIKALKELLQIDQDRLEAVQHNIFMEQLRNRILRQTSSARLLELRGQEAIERDAVARRQKELDAIEKRKKAEEDSIKKGKTALELQIEALEQKIATNDRQIALQEESVHYQREELELAKAAQVEARLRLQMEERMLQDRQTFLQHEADIINSQNAILERQVVLYREVLTDLEEIRDKGLDAAMISQYPDIAKLQQAVDFLERALQLEIKRLEIEERASAAAEKAIEKSAIAVAAQQSIIVQYATGIWKAVTEAIEKAFPRLSEAAKKSSAVVFTFANDWLRQTQAHFARIFNWFQTLIEMATLGPGLATERATKRSQEIEERLRRTMSEEYRDMWPAPVVPDRSLTDGGLPMSTKSYTTVGPTINLTANYARAQSPASVLADVQTLLSLV